MSVRRILVVLLPVVFTAVAASAQTSAAATPEVPVEQSRWWIAIGGAATTLRGDCQEDCPAHGTGKYWQTGSFVSSIGYRVNRQMDAGVQVSWAPVTTEAGDHVRSTALLAVAQFRPWASSGFLLRGGMGMTFVKNFVYSTDGTLPPLTSKALGLTYGAGWAFRRTERLGLELLGSQHVAALGDFQTGGQTLESVVVNFWSFGASVVIR